MPMIQTHFSELLLHFRWVRQQQHPVSIRVAQLRNYVGNVQFYEHTWIRIDIFAVSHWSNQIKSNHFYCHITTAQVPWWVKFLWACSRQCRKTTDNLHMDRQSKKTTNNLRMDRQCKKMHWSIYSAPDSAKKNNNSNLHIDRQCKKNNNSNLHIDRQCKKKKKKKKTTTAIYIWTDSAKKTTAIYIWTDSAKKKTTTIYIWTDSAKKNYSNLHMDSTYLQTVQKTMCKIHIHALSTLSVL